jgi:hypothetical protein
MEAAGAVAERLGRGLQSPVQRFESAPRLLDLLQITPLELRRRQWVNLACRTIRQKGPFGEDRYFQPAD